MPRGYREHPYTPKISDRMDNRGRSRGRARDSQPARPQIVGGGGHPRGAPSAPGPSAPRPGGAWGQGDGRGVNVPTPVRSAPPPHRGGGDVAMEVVRAGGNGNGRDAHAGRGAVRGRRPISENIVTRSTELTKQGSSGTPIVLQTNYFKLLKKPNWTLYHYKVSFAPEQDVTFHKKKLFQTAIQSTLKLNSYLFDGEQLYSITKIQPDPMEMFVKALFKEDEQVRVSIKLVRDVQEGDYVYLQVFNILLRKCMGYMELQQVGRDYFDAKNKIPVQNLNLEIWPGGITTLRQHENDILMLHETKFKIMRRDTVLDMINEYMQNQRGGGHWTERFKEDILNQIVLTDYNNKTYRIDDVSFDITPASKFKRKDGSEISYAQYYKERYGITIRNPTQPCLIHHSKEREVKAGMPELINLIPELCRRTGICDSIKNNFTKMNELSNYTKPTPKSRIAKLQDFSKRFLGNEKVAMEIKSWEMKLSSEVLTLNGRQIGPQTIHFGNGHKCAANASADWTNELRSTKMFRDQPLNNWAIVFPARMERDVRNFLSNADRVANGMKWVLGQAQPASMQDDRIGSYDRKMDELARGRFQLICVILPKNDQQKYSAIKKKLTVHYGIPSQVVTGRVLSSKNLLSITTKICIQMNTKIGGAPWTVDIPLKSTMFIGYDACHDPKNKRNSYGAFVASLDNQCSKFYSLVAHHKDGEELSNFMASNIAIALRYYKEVRGELPNKIMFFRDGVGDGQLEYVYNTELSNIKKTCAQIYNMDAEKIPLRFIIVNKRINTRFFLRGENPKPGTVVDDVVTLPNRSDFYLIPQCTRVGTVSPTYYSILGQDAFGLSTDKTQLMTYKLCHNFFNWSGTVKVPAPCQYAHKLAFLTATYLGAAPHERLKDLLHFL